MSEESTYSSLISFGSAQRTVLDSRTDLPSVSPRSTKALILQLATLFLALRVTGQSIQVLPEWKAHFSAPIIVENCIFVRTVINSSSGTESNLYQCKYQSNGYMIREITSLDQANSNIIPKTGFYAGRFLSNYWAIDNGPVLKLFPNADAMMAARNNGDAALVFTAQTVIMSALFYGINLIDPASVRWLDEESFEGRSVDGRRFSGRILKVDGNRPTRLEWFFKDRQQTHYFLEYSYGRALGIAYYPSEFRLYRHIVGETASTLIATHNILMLNQATVAMTEATLSGSNYFTPSQSLVSTFTVTSNGTYFASADGKLEKVLPLTASSVRLETLEGPHSLKVRIAFAVFFLMSIVALLFAWKKLNITNSSKH